MSCLPPVFLPRLSLCADGSSPAVREEVKLENGRSPLLGSSLSESEGTEMMEGAAAAVGRQQSLGTIVESSLVCYIVASDCLLLLCFCFFRPQAHWSFRCLVRGRVNRTMARNPTRLHPRRSPLCIRVTALNQHSPDLLRYTNNLLRYRPNPSTGYLITLQVRFVFMHAHGCVPDSVSHTSSLSFLQTAPR